MDKTVGVRGRGGSELPLRLRGLALLLSLFLFCFSFIPHTVYAAVPLDSKVTEIGLKYSDSSHVTGYPTYVSIDKLGRIIDNNHKQDWVENIFIRFTCPDVSSSYTYNVNMVFDIIRYYSFHFVISNDNYEIISEFDVKYNTETDEYSFKQVSNGTTIVRNLFVLNLDLPKSSGYRIYISDIKYSPGYDPDTYPAAFGLGAFSVTQQDNKTNSLLSNIIDYIKKIVSDIGELPSKIGNFISSLGDKISGLFTNLTNNIKGWFADVGKWFSDLGKNIQQWFTNLVNNLKTWFDNIGKWFKDIGDRIGGFFTTIWNNTVEFFTSLFKPSDDYFENLRIDLDNHMSEHLGAVYNVPKELIRQLTSIVNGLKGSNANHLYLSIPDIEFTLNGKRHVLVEAARYDLLSFVSSMPSAFKSIYNVVLVIMHGMIDLALALACFKMIYRKIINKVGIEGGDEL